MSSQEPKDIYEKSIVTFGFSRDKMPNGTKQIGIVIECYDHNKAHRVLVVQSNDKPKLYHFFYIPKNPQVDFGDKIQMNFTEDKFYVCRGNSKLTYRFFPRTFPGTLLLELKSEYLD